MPNEDIDLIGAAQAAAFSAELAAINLKKYQELHTPKGDNIAVVKLVMKIAEDVKVDAGNLVSDAVDFALKNLQQYKETTAKK
jgi:hypothetical protein